MWRIAHAAMRQSTPERGGDAGAACRAVELRRFDEHLLGQRGLEDREGQHRGARDREGALVAEALEDLLHDRQRRHHVVEVDGILEAEPLWPREHLDPDRGVNEDHGVPSSVPSRTAGVFANDRQVALPQAAAGEIENPAGLQALDELLERAFDRPRVRPLATQLDRLLEQLLINHKICAFHVYSVRPGTPVRQMDAGTGRASRDRRARRSSAAAGR